MFGRRTGFGTRAPSPPPPPPSDIWPPYQKMDSALDAAIRLITRALDSAGHDCGGLAIRGPVPTNVAKLLSDCIVYQGENGPGYLTLGLTRDLKGFSYQPHCRLFMIINSVLLLEDPISSELRGQIAVSQTSRALVDAHMMKRWIKYIRPVGKAAAAGDGDGLKSILLNIRREVAEGVQAAPAWISEHVNLNECADEWTSGFPGTIGRQLSPDVKRLNDLPMSDFVHKQLIDFMAETQARGMARRG